MNKTILIVKEKQDSPERIGDLTMRIVMQQDVSFGNFDVGMINSTSHFLHAYKDEVIEYFEEHGYANYLRSGILNESVLKSGATQPEILKVLHKYLAKLEIDNELIIVEPYFYATSHNPDYSEFIKDVFEPFIASLDILRVITIDNPSKINATVKSDIENKLKGVKPTLNIIHTRSNSVHDRYLISSGRQKGMLIGTSFNGLGNKLALIDRLNTSDVREIVQDLVDNGLL